MASSIDASVPVEGSPTTASVRAQFATAKSEIEALQAADEALTASLDGKQDASDILDLLGGLTPAADKLVRFTGTASADLVTLSTAGADLIAQTSGAAMLTALGLSSFGQSLVDDADAAAARTTLGIEDAVKGTARTFTAAQRSTITTLADGTTITPDFAASNDFTVTLEGNRTLANPTNAVAGQGGSIFIAQDGTGSRTLSYGTDWEFPGGTAPTLTTTASAVDRLDYVVRASGSIHANLAKDVK